MEKEEKVEKKEKKGVVGRGVRIIKDIVYIVLVLSIMIIFYSKCAKTKVTYESSSNLIKIEDVTKFNLAKYEWDGIAEYYREGKEKVDTYIKYKAEIVASMDVDNINNNIRQDEANKKLYIKLPKIELVPTIIFKDDGSGFSFIPKSSDVEVKDMVSVCEADAKTKVAERTKMLDIAKDNAKSTIEGLLLPLVEGQNYTIVWEDGE